MDRLPASIVRIQATIDYIDEHLDDALDIQQLAARTEMSFWHFLRVFRATVGETVKDYIRRRRLTRAAYELLETQQNIIDVAFGAGFETHEAFTRAFRAQFGASPREFRAQGLPPKLPRGIPHITTDYLSHLHSGLSTEAEFVDSPARRLVGIKSEFSVAPEAFDLIELGLAAWKEFEPLIAAIPVRANALAGLCSDITGADERSIQGFVMPCIEVTEFANLPEGLVALVRPPCREARFSHRGGGQTWEYTLQYIFGAWLPDCHFTVADQPAFFTFDPEHSPFSPDPVVDYWLALR
ncbi:helix-turn-helix domain-containing protein [Niveibacterium terrae]|uniref:helix-turn-helix domain-containing protein n=1 Tax=Niveibacterium terrae TaxID=3373598 RepID=UPI003A8FD6D2